MSYINSINNNETDYLISGVSDIIICSTSASTIAKTASAMDAFTLDSNLSFKIKFTNGNTASSPTLNLNNTGAKSITTTTSNYTLVAGIVYDCYYDGSNYVLDNQLTIHTANTSNPHNVTKSQVGLGNVDNTADANKSVAYSSNSGKLDNKTVQSTSIGGSTTETTNYWSYIEKSKFTTDGGYIKYSNGLIMQWQYFASKPRGYINFNLLLAFSNTNYYLGCESTNASEPIRMFSCSIDSRTTQSFKMKAYQIDSNDENEYTSSFVIFAIGY